MKLSAKPFYRKASALTPKEDGVAINETTRMYAVCDGVSEPYSPSNPGLQYEGQLTGGQMVSKTVCAHVTRTFPSSGICNALLNANREVFASHLVVGKNPAHEAVAGASVAACQIFQEEALVVLIGDCFILYGDDNGFHFLTNFDQAAFDFEERGNEVFAQRLSEAKGNKSLAWDLYFPYFSDKQFFRANRNIRNGGHAVLNGSPSLLDCWTARTIDTSSLKWILIGTDGLLTATSNNPKNRERIEQEIGQLYSKKGLRAIIDWRDEEDYQPHIGIGNPEASAIELKFD